MENRKSQNLNRDIIQTFDIPSSVTTVQGLINHLQNGAYSNLRYNNDQSDGGALVRGTELTKENLLSSSTSTLILGRDDETTTVDEALETLKKELNDQGGGEGGKKIEEIKQQYYQSTSQTETKGGSWQETPPLHEDEKYIWTRIVIHFVDGEEQTTDPINNTGAAGRDGINAPAQWDEPDENTLSTEKDVKLNTLAISTSEDGMFTKLSTYVPKGFSIEGNLSPFNSYNLGTRDMPWNILYVNGLNVRGEEIHFDEKQWYEPDEKTFQALGRNISFLNEGVLTRLFANNPEWSKMETDAPQGFGIYGDVSPPDGHNLGKSDVPWGKLYANSIVVGGEEFTKDDLGGSGGSTEQQWDDSKPSTLSTTKKVYIDNDLTIRDRNGDGGAFWLSFYGATLAQIGFAAKVVSLEIDRTIHPATDAVRNIGKSSERYLNGWFAGKINASTLVLDGQEFTKTDLASRSEDPGASQAETEIYYYGIGLDRKGDIMSFDSLQGSRSGKVIQFVFRNTLEQRSAVSLQLTEQIAPDVPYEIQVPIDTTGLMEGLSGALVLKLDSCSIDGFVKREKLPFQPPTIAQPIVPVNISAYVDTSNSMLVITVLAGDMIEQGDFVLLPNLTFHLWED